MTQVGNNENRFGGEYMIQDSDHMSGIAQVTDNKRSARQADQSQASGRQQGSVDQNASAQQGGERSSIRRRQSH